MLGPTLATLLLGLGDVFDGLPTEANFGMWVTVVVVLLLSGIGLPLPEDVPLTVSGYLTAQGADGHFIFWRYAFTFVLVTIPILAGDVVAYGMGRRWGFSLVGRLPFLARALSEKRLDRVRRWFEHYGSFTVFMGRQMAGVRFATFFTAGAMHMSLPKFIFFDFLGALISVPVWLTLGHYTFVHGREWLDLAAKNVSTVIIGAWVILGIAFVGYLRVKARRPAAASAPHPTTAAPVASPEDTHVR